MKVFLDANILFSSSAKQSRVRLLISVIQNYGSCVTNSYAVEEARRNIIAKKFGSLEQLELLLEKIYIDNTLVLNLPVTLPEKGSIGVKVISSSYRRKGASCEALRGTKQPAPLPLISCPM